MAPIGDVRYFPINIEHSLGDLVSASKISSKQRNTAAVDVHLHAVCEFAYRNGLPPHALNTVLGLVRQQNYLDQPIITALCQNLYPDGLVPSGAINLVVSCLGEGRHKPSSSTQLLLLRWVILVYHVLEDRKVVSNLYSTLFNMLDMISIRAPLCHILATVTQRKHVRPFRIQALSNFLETFGPEPALVELMRIYKQFHPNITIEDARWKRASPFTCPDPMWRDHLRQLHATVMDNLCGNVSSDMVGTYRRESKRPRISTIPTLSSTGSSKKSAGLEDIHAAEDLVNNLEIIEAPSQMISAIENMSLQKYMLLKSDEPMKKRLDHWLAHFFEEELSSMNETGNYDGRLTEVLEKLLSYTRYTKVLLPSTVLFFERYLTRWGGTQHRDTLLNLLTYLDTESFEDLYSRIFTLLEDAILDDTAESAADLLHYYSALLSRWLGHSIAERDKPVSEVVHRTTTLNALIKHASLLSLSILCSYAPEEKILSTIFSYYETLAYASSLATTDPSVIMEIPATLSVYLAIFHTTSLSSLSRSCSVLATYKKVFESLPQAYPSEHKNQLNSLLMDTCNLLWRSRAFNTSDANAAGCLLPTPLISSLRNYVDDLDLSLSGLFSLSHNSTSAALSASAFRNIEDAAEDQDEGSLGIRHTGPVTHRSLLILKGQGGIDTSWTQYRLKVLSLLEDMGVDGMRELMFCTMKDLIGTAS